MELRRLKLEALDLSLGRLRQFPEAAVRKMAASLRSKGQLSALVAADEDGRLVLIDGFVRVLAAKRVGLSELAVEVVQVDGVQMKAQVYLRNRERGLQLVEVCRLVRELVEVDGLSQVEVADLLERHKSWVCRRLALFRRLSAKLVEEVELGELPAGSLCRLAELPERNQEELWAAARSHGVSGRDVGLLADLWRRAPEPAARAWLLAHPDQAVLSARLKEEQRTIDARLGAAGEEVRRALEVLCRVSSTLASRVRRGLGELAPEGVLELQDAWERARDRSQSALELLRRALEGRND